MKSINSRRINFAVKQSSIRKYQGSILMAVVVVFASPFIASEVSELEVTEPVAVTQEAVIETPKVSVAPSAPAAAEPVSPVKRDLASIFESYKIPGVETLEKEKDTNAIKLTLSSDSFFQSGTATLKEDSLLPLNEIVEVIKATEPKVMIEVEGHTDDSPIVKQKKLYQSNWELSTARATLMIHAFESAGFNKEQLKVVGYGDSRPILPNRTPSGESIVSNLTKNRRIVVRIFQGGSDQSSL